jgi:hypothetical protein
MIAEVKGARLLQGFRGQPAADLEALEDALVRVSYLAMHIEGYLAELDINPLMVLPSGQGVKAVDVSEPRLLRDLGENFCCRLFGVARPHQIEDAKLHRLLLRFASSATRSPGSPRRLAAHLPAERL